jgi:hypothetical protein
MITINLQSNRVRRRPRPRAREVYNYPSYTNSRGEDVQQGYTLHATPFYTSFGRVLDQMCEDVLL